MSWIGHWFCNAVNLESVPLTHKRPRFPTINPKRFLTESMKHDEKRTVGHHRAT